MLIRFRRLQESAHISPASWNRTWSCLTVVLFFLTRLETQPGITCITGLGFRCICHLGNPVRLVSSQVFVCCVHRMASVACRPIIKCGKSACILDLVRSLWWNMGIHLGRSQPRAGLVGKHSRDRTYSLRLLTESKSSPAMSRRSRNVSPAMSRKSSVVSWSDSPREQWKRTVMEDGTETHQAEINKKINANDKLRTILTNRLEEHRSLIYGDSFKSKWNRWMMRKLPCWQPQGNSYPCKVESTNRKTIWSESRKRSDRNRRSVWKSCENGSRLIRNWKQPTLHRYKPNKRWRCWWLNMSAENAKLSIKGIQGFSLACQDPSLIKLHNTPFSQCSNPFSRCKAWCVTVFRNSSWRLEQPRKMSRKSVRLWHRQRGHWRQGSRPLNLVARRIASRATWWARTKSSPMEYAYPDSATWTPKEKKPS